MRTYLHTSFAVLVLLSVTIPAAGQPAPPGADPTQAIAEVTVLPRHHQWSLVDPVDRPPLEQVARLTAEQRDRLVRDGSARERGIAIFAADQQGDIAWLLRQSALLSDNERTVPYARPVAHVGGFAQADQTVSAYLRTMYLEWFGVDVDQSPERFETLLGAVTDSRHLVRPWIVRLRRARDNTEAGTAIREEIRTLPEPVRGVVITLAWSDSLYPAEQARTDLSALSAGTRETIRNRTDYLPDEPLFRANRGAYRKVVRQKFERLMNESAVLPDHVR